MSDTETNDHLLESAPTGRLLIRLFRSFETRVVEGLVEAGFDDASLSHFSVLRHLNLEGLRISELARDAGVTKQAMGQMVKELVKRGYIDVGPDPTDGRAKLVSYSEEGRRFILAARQVVGDIEGQFCNTLGEESYRQMRRALITLIEVRSTENQKTS